MPVILIFKIEKESLHIDIQLNVYFINAYRTNSGNRLCER